MKTRAFFKGSFPERWEMLPECRGRCRFPEYHRETQGISTIFPKDSAGMVRGLPKISRNASPGNESISHHRKRKIIDSKVPAGGGQIGSNEDEGTRRAPTSW